LKTINKQTLRSRDKGFCQHHQVFGFKDDPSDEMRGEQGKENMQRYTEKH
jgi:hypothetical protein